MHQQTFKSGVATVVVLLALPNGLASFRQLTKDAQGNPANTSAVPAQAMKLLAAGALPRVLFRYGPNAKTQTEVKFDQQVETLTEVQGQPTPTTLNGRLVMPPLRIVFESDPAVSSSSELTSRFHVVLAVFTPGDNSNFVETAETGQITSGLSAMEGRTAMGGGNFKTELTKISPLVRQLMPDLITAIEDLPIRFPDEAIGLGARWELQRSVQTEGYTILRTQVLEVAAINPDSVTLTIKLEGTAQPQPLKAATIPGSTDHLNKASVSGSGSITVRKESWLPEGTLETTARTSIASRLGGDAGLVTDTNRRVSIVLGAPVKK